MSDDRARVAVIAGASQGIGAGLVAGYRAQGWAVVANSLKIKPSEDPPYLATFLAGHELRPKVWQPFVPVSADAHPRGVGTGQRPDLRWRP